jgi:2-oxoisovalerate dehydrogenase E1 component
VRDKFSQQISNSIFKNVIMDKTREKKSQTDQLDNTNEGLNRTEILDDYRLALISRQLSIIGRKEVHSGRAKFGIFGDGKEIAQIAYEKCFKKGDWRAGYYRDQTFMLAAGLLTPEEFFAQLYGDTDDQLNPSTGGRNFNNHFATKNISKDGSWEMLTNLKNSSSDVSPTAGQMPRLLGLAYASKLFRNIEHLWQMSHLSNFGNEVAFGTIGEASTSEGLFFETMNAACVMQIPLAIAIWDDGFGISVPVEMQTVKGSISKALKGFQKEKDGNGCLIYTCKGWDYPGLVKMFSDGISICRKEHIPALFHVDEMTQPLGHSTSGSHERYKSHQRLEWEDEFDPIRKMKEWMLKEKISDVETLDKIEEDATNLVKEARHKAWENYIKPYLREKEGLLQFINNYPPGTLAQIKALPEYNSFVNNPFPRRKDIMATGKKILQSCSLDKDNLNINKKIALWLNGLQDKCTEIYSSKLYVENKHSVGNVNIVKPVYGKDPVLANGRELLNKNFDYLFQKYPMLVAFGEDAGKIGDVNQGFKGLQQKYGDLRISDTSIREPSIIGQGIGLALRGFRPIAEIQYLDYLIYGLQTISDDLATTHYRTKGGQVAPVIIRTRGHRLIGMWHSGSPLGMIINAARGVNICVPRNMTQAAGFYNTLMEVNDPAIVIEALKGYDLKEYVPDNIGEFNVPLGVPEIIETGSDITVVTYGYCVNLAQEATVSLRKLGVSVELIDVQTLIPFDIHHIIVNSIKKTSHVLFLDEDVPGGATAYMMEKVLNEQNAFFYLDSPPKALTAKEHRSAYDTDGNYFSKPNAETIVETVYNIMRDQNPAKFPEIFFTES